MSPHAQAPRSALPEFVHVLEVRVALLLVQVKGLSKSVRICFCLRPCKEDLSKLNHNLLAFITGGFKVSAVVVQHKDCGRKYKKALRKRDVAAVLKALYCTLDGTEVGRDRRITERVEIDRRC